MKYTVGPKGQIVIAKDLRERLGVEPGWLALQRVEGDHLVVYFLPPEHRESQWGVFAPYITRSISDEEWPEAREHAWRQAVIEEEAPYHNA